MMENFKPTEEQLFDYHLGMADPELTRQIDTYMQSHPEAKAQLQEFSQIEAGFQDFPLSEPSDQVLQRVRDRAYSEVQPGFFNFLKHTVVPRRLAWAMMIFVVVGLSFALNELRKTDPYSPGLASTPVAISTNGDALENGAANFSGTLTEMALQPVQIDKENAKIFQDFTKALSFYHQSRFKEANDLFQEIVATNPRFDKRVELYTFWIKTLDKMGDSQLANQKRLELQKIQDEIQKKGTM